jgi:hypothetical protein
MKLNKFTNYTDTNNKLYTELPDTIDGADVCNRQCWFCEGRMDDPARRRECMTQMCIYEGQCMICADAGVVSKYVGQTTQRVKTRAGQHMSACCNPNFLNNNNDLEQRLQNVVRNGGSDKHLPSAVALHHHRQHPGQEPRWEWKVIDTAKTVNELDAKEASVQTYGGGYNVNHNVVTGPM